MGALIKTCLCFLSLVIASEARFNKYDRLKAVFEYIQTNETLMDMYNAHLHQHKLAREHLLKHTNRTNRGAHSFDCGTYQKSTSPATSVHALRPEHVSVVAAMGDSLTAGNGILGSNILDCLTEYRGRSWSIGGDLNIQQGVETLPNILREFHPTASVKGASLGKCDTSNKGCSLLNVAVAGETSQEMPRQANDLINRLTDPAFGVNYTNEWKVITLFIGGNDLCAYCHNSNLHSPDNYIAKIRDALDILHANVPKAFVNLVQIFDITPLAQVSQGFFCNLVTNMVCDCAKDGANNAMLSIASAEYQKRIRDLVATGRYDTRDDFTVVLQPFFQNTEPVRDATGRHDLAYFAPDCFHFSDLGTNAAGKSLWNNMIEPLSAKQSEWHLHEPFHCPHTHGAGDSVFRTAKN